VKLLLIGDGAATGFGRVGRELAQHFLDAGVDIRWLAINWGDRLGEVSRMYQMGAKTDKVIEVLQEIEADPLTPFKMAAGAFGDGMGYNLTGPAVHGQLWDGWKPEAVLVVADPRAMIERLQHDQGAAHDVPFYNYVPIEGVNPPPLWRAIWEHVTPIAMSEFGRNELQQLLGRPVAMVPHGVSDTFWEISPNSPGKWKGTIVNSKVDAKRQLGFGDRTVLLRTDRLVPRKDYPALFRSLAPVLERHSDTVLVVHCSPQDEGGSLVELVSHLPGAYETNGSWTHPQVIFTRAHDTFRGLSDEDLNVLYNAADIYVSPTMAEGFGLCLAEAASVGVPVVTTDYAAGPEAVGPGAVLVPPRTHFTNVYAHDWALIDEDKFGAAVEHLIDKPAKRREIGQAGKRYVTGRFTWQAAADQFLDILGYEREALAA
jgi:glycosyltransferase involved in cell wall biosynthesis